MKKIISLALIAGIISNGVSYLSADETQASESTAAPQVNQEVSPPTSNVSETNISGQKTEINKSTSTGSPESKGDQKTEENVSGLVAPIKKWVLEHKKPLAVVGFFAALYASHKVMVSVCPWYKQLVGADEEEEETTRSPRFDLLNPERPY